ncbi:hypothetical protein ACX80W_12215 [Arthrobacter sp. TMN-37]
MLSSAADSTSQDFKLRVIEDMRDTQGSMSLGRFVRGTWTLLVTALVFAVAIFFSVFSLSNGSHGLEIAALLVLGLVGGGLARGLFRENLVMAVFIVLIVGECALFSQLSGPWSSLWPVLIPANAIGVMVGNVVRLGYLESRPRALRDVWVVNGVEEPRTDSAKAVSTAVLSAWDSAHAGRFYVERNEGLFEAMGSAATGFIVHCAAKSQEESAWQILGSLGGRGETEIRIPSGPAFAPSGVVVDLETAKEALLGFFHHRGPDPGLEWTSGEEVLDLKFG